MSHPHPPCPGKRLHSNKKAARLAHVRAGWGIRAYWCTDCTGYHVANRGKDQRKKSKRLERERIRAKRTKRRKARAAARKCERWTS